MPTPFAVVITTCGGKPEAEAIAARLVEKRLAACVQIFPSPASIGGKAR